MGTVTELVAAPTIKRLQDLTVTYRDAVERFEAIRDDWQHAITDAIDAGVPNKTVARAIGVSSPRVTAIVARVYGSGYQPAA